MRVKRPNRPPAADRERPAEGRGRKPPRRRLRLNFKAAAVLVAVAALAVAGSLALQKSRTALVRRQAIAEALRAEQSGQVDQAIRNLRRYLDTRPDDLPALEVLARIMAKSARSVDEAMEAARVNDRLLRRDPEGVDRQETRRRMVDLYVRCGDSHRASAIYRLLPQSAAFDLRYRAAEQIARDLLERDRKGKADVAGDRRLLAMALEGLAVPGDRQALEGSIGEYEAALKGDPADAVSAERLANLYRGRMNDPARAVKVLDELIGAAPGSPDARLVRHRYFLKARRNDLAAAELEKATELAPADLRVRLTAAGDALRRADAATAKRHLDAIAESSRDDLRVRVMRGMIQFSEENPDRAIDSWREGLLLIGGTDADLTWWLAHALLQMGRVSEARPLVAQYYRLSGEETRALHRFLQAELDEKTGRPGRAILGLEWARDRIGEYWQPTVQLALGRCYEALWDQARALAAYRRAALLDPQLAEARIAAARVLIGKPDEAIREIERGLALTPDEPSLLVALASARLLQQSGRPADRRDWADFDRSLARASAATATNSALPLMQADRLTLSGDLSGAIALLEAATARSPHNVSLWTAWAEGLGRTGRPTEALKILDRAADPGAVGDRAPIRIARAKVLLALGRGREAREGLTRGERGLKLADRPPLWEAVGRLDAARGDYRSARAAFTEWARLLPDDPHPRLALLELAQAAGDESAIRSTVETLHELGGPEDIAWRLCRAQELLWAVGSSGQPVHRRDAKLVEAGRIIESVLVDAPEVPSAHLLKADILRRLNKLDEAVTSYRRAWDRGAGAALPRMIELLVRLRKFDDLDGLRLRIEGLDLDRLSAAASLRVGDAEATDRFVRQAVEDARDAPGSSAWQARMFESIGKPDEAEAALRAAAERKPDEVDRWLDLVRVQAKHGKAAAAAATIEKARGLIKSEVPGVLEARLRWAADDRPGADRAFRAALAARRDDAGLRLLAARYYEETGRPAEAAACLGDALRVDPKGRAAARQMAIVLASDPATWPRAAEMVGAEVRADDAAEDRLARAMVMARGPDAARKGLAIALFEDLASDLPASNTVANAARDGLIRLLLEAGRPDRAAEVAMVAARTSTDPAVIALYVETLIRSKKFVEAFRQLDRLAAIRPGDPDEAALRVRCLSSSVAPAGLAEALEKAAHERHDEPGGEAFGREAFTMLVALTPPALDRAGRVAREAASDRPAASWMPAHVLALRGQDAEALALCRASLDSPDPGDLRGAARVAMTVAIRNQSDTPLLAQVDKMMDGILRREPKHHEVAVLAAMLRHIQGRYEDEARLYREALALLPDDPTATNNLAWILSEGLNRTDEALALVDALIARDGRKPDVLDTRGVILTRAAQYDAAIRDLEESVAAVPSPVIYFHLAVACRKAGRDDQFRKNRDLALKAGFSADQVDPTERDEAASMLKP